MFVLRAKSLLVIAAVVAVATSCTDRNGTIEAIFRLRADSPLPSWLALPARVNRKDVDVTITDYEATTTPEWKVKFVVRDAATGRRLQEALGRGYWHPDSEREKAPAATYPHWVIIEVNGSKDVYEQSERNDLIKIVKKP
jgi:hypothetical protein